MQLQSTWTFTKKSINRSYAYAFENILGEKESIKKKQTSFH